MILTRLKWTHFKKKISSSATEGQKKWGKRTMEGVFQLFLCYRINLIENLKNNCIYLLSDENSIWY